MIREDKPTQWNRLPPYRRQEITVVLVAAVIGGLLALIAIATIHLR
jgi:hypothetical protein